MKRKDPISAVMTQEVKTVQVDAPLSAVRRMFMPKHFHHVPILDGDKLVGIISARDMMRLSYEAYGSNEQDIDDSLDARHTVCEIMQTELVTMCSDELVGHAVDILGDGAIHSVLIVDPEGAFVGIVTNIDLLEYLFS